MLCRPHRRDSDTKINSTRPNEYAELITQLEIQRRNRAATENPITLHATGCPPFRIWMMAMGVMMLLMAPTYGGAHQSFSFVHFISARFLVFAWLGM